MGRLGSCVWQCACCQASRQIRSTRFSFMPRLQASMSFDPLAQCCESGRGLAEDGQVSAAVQMLLRRPGLRVMSELHFRPSR